MERVIQYILNSNYNWEEMRDYSVVREMLENLQIEGLISFNQK